MTVTKDAMKYKLIWTQHCYVGVIKSIKPGANISVKEFFIIIAISHVNAMAETIFIKTIFNESFIVYNKLMHV